MTVPPILGQHEWATISKHQLAQINIIVDSLAEDYWDCQLPLYLCYGFPMDFKGSHGDLISATESQASAWLFPEHVSTYLQDEIQHKAIYCPFDSKLFGEATHVYPFITRTKQDSHKRRVIIDLSWPVGASVNHFMNSNLCMGTALKLSYPSIDNFTDRLRRLEKGSLMLKIDLSWAFHQLKVDPADFPLLGHRTGAMGCTRLSDFHK